MIVCKIMAILFARRFNVWADQRRDHLHLATESSNDLGKTAGA